LQTAAGHEFAGADSVIDIGSLAFVVRLAPAGSRGPSADVGEAAVFLASDGARYITGHMLVIDGGILAIQNSWSPPA